MNDKEQYEEIIANIPTEEIYDAELELLKITSWDDIYFDENKGGFESLTVMDSDLGFDEALTTYFQQHEIQPILSLQGYGALVTSPEGKFNRLFLDKLDIDETIEKACLWIDNNYSFVPEQMLIFPHKDEWLNKFLTLEKILNDELKQSFSKYKQEHYIVARLICCYFGGNQLNFFSIFLEEVFEIKSRAINSVFKKLQNMGIIEYETRKDNSSTSKIYQINNFVVPL